MRPAGDAGSGIGFDQIDVVVHPQSIVHSMVEFTDAATIAQLSLPDMRLPIGYALAYPDRITTPFGRHRLGPAGPARLRAPRLEPPSPACELAYEAGRQGETAPAWLNAANEVAVDAFLAGSHPLGRYRRRSSRSPSSATMEPRPPMSTL